MASVAPRFPRLAIIGCGAVVAHHLAPALRRIGWTPDVLVDLSEQHIEKVAARFSKKASRFVTAADWQAVADRFDAALVATPHVLHGPIGKALVAAGKHVFMEKPLALTTADCREMIAAADEAGVVLSVGLLRRYLHVAGWLKALLDAGVMGEIRRFEAREGFVFNWATSTDAMLRRDKAGGGVLTDTGAHTLDLLLWWFGDVRWLRYRDDSAGGIEADCIAHFRFESGAKGSLELSRTRNLRNTIRIEGTNGFVEAHLYKNEIVAASPNVRAFEHGGIGSASMPKQLFSELFDAELADFGASAAGGERRGVSGADGAASVELIERCYAARRPLPLPWDECSAGAALPDVDAIGPDTTVVVTGASGFIGGRLAERLALERGARVRCLVRNIAQSTRLARLPVEIVRVDLCDAAGIKAAVDGADLVFHCAYDPVSRGQNLDGMRNLIAACSDGKVRRLVHVSTFSVYEPFRDGDLTEETPDGDRSWIYVRNKLDLEKEVLEAARSGRCPATVIQPAVVYGPFGKSWTNVPAEMLLYGTVVLPDRGEGLCNCVYVDDLVDAMMLAAVRHEAIGERFIVSGPEPVPWARFFERFAKTLGTPSPVFRPAERIARAQRSVMRDVRLVLNDPKKIMQIIVRWDPARRALQAGLDAMPRPLHALVIKYYFERRARPLGQEYLPDKQLLGLYSAKPVVRNEKAARLLGYRPRFDFDAGMAATMAYVEWAYGDVRQALRPAPVETSRSPLFGSPSMADAS